MLRWLVDSPPLLDGDPTRREGLVRLSITVVMGLLLATRSIAAANAKEPSRPALDSGNVPSASRKSLDSRTILLVRTPGDEGVMTRVRADLGSVGFHIVEIPIEDEGVLGESLERLAAEHRAAAALRVDGVLGQVEIYVGKGWGNAYEVLNSEAGPDDGQLLALRTTEALRAHGLDVGPEPGREREPKAVPNGSSASSAVPPLPPNVARVVSRAVVIAPVQTQKPEARAFERGVWLALGPAARISPGGLGIGLASLFGSRLELSPLLSLTATGQLPLYSPAIVEPEGTADVATTVLGLGFEVTWLRRAHLLCSTGLELTVLRTVAQGRDTQTGYLTSRDSTWTNGAQLRWRLGLPLSPRWRLFGELDGGVSFPEVRVEIDDHVVRTWGQPYAVLALNVEFRTLTWR